MKKNELKQSLRKYLLIEKELGEKSKMAEICRNRKTERIEIKPWMYRISDYLTTLQRTQSVIIRDIIEEKIKKGKSDQRVLQNLPISESTYYRLKKQIVDMVYALYILFGDVTAEEILSEKIE